MEELGRNIFLATQYMRHHSAPLYTPEPDVIHELVGHAALLADEKFARVNRLFGAVAKDVDDAHVEALIRVYWYALEFGVARCNSGLQVVGAGLLSSFGELGRFETQAKLRPFSIDEIARTPFDPTEYQGTLFVADSAELMLTELTRWLESL
jgi:phenylalanine-4-hydroxylase